MSITTANVIKIIDQKTARILIVKTRRHEINGKVQRLNRELLADIQCQEKLDLGDLVEISECQKVSKTKAFAILKVLKKSH